MPRVVTRVVGSRVELYHTETRVTHKRTRTPHGAGARGPGRAPGGCRRALRQQPGVAVLGKNGPVAGLSADSSPTVLQSQRGYRRAETADGPRWRQSVLHMRAQMLRSLFLARCGSIQSLHSRPLCAGSLLTPPFFFCETCALSPQEHTGIGNQASFMKAFWGSSNRISGRGQRVV